MGMRLQYPLSIYGAVHQITPTRYCAEVTEPNEQFNTTWPEGTDERRFVIASPHRAFYILAENAEERM